jgi:hypothetical protein
MRSPASFFRGNSISATAFPAWGGIEIQQPGGATINLDESETGRLIMVPDGSTVWALTVWEQDEAPAGLDVMSNSPFMAEDENTSVIAFRDD